MFKLLAANLKIISRNKQALFWSFMFPLMFTFIFGLFFGKNSSVGTVAFIDHSKTELSQSIRQSIDDADMFTIIEENSLDDAKDLVKKNTVSVIVEIPESFAKQIPDADNDINILYDQGSAQVGSTINSFIGHFLTQTNYQVQAVKPIFSVTSVTLSDKELSYFDFVLSGILGLALMNSSIIGIAVGMTKYREDKILKRITTTPIKSWQFVSAEVVSRLALNFLQITLILLIGKYFFDAHIYGNIFVIFALAIIGAILFQLIGFTIASFSKTTSAAEGMATALTIPMMFLAGVFFPIDSLPKWLYSIVQYLPLAPLLRMIRSVTLEAVSPFQDPRNIMIVGGWIVVCFIISVYKFRLSDE
jgi:ABC-2 type transport system permease protein